MEVSRDQVLRFRVHAQQLDREPEAEASTAASVLDIGVQDTGPDGSLWALELRGFAPDPKDLFTAWTLRGAPHVYRRAQAAAVAAAVAPVSEADAAKRVFDAARPLKQAGIPVLEALDRVAGEMRSIVTKPTVKGDVSGALNARLPEPYQRFCRPCNTVHIYEQPFRFSALRGGLELTPGTSPPVLAPHPRLEGHGREGGSRSRPRPGRAPAAGSGHAEAGRGLPRLPGQGRPRSTGPTTSRPSTSRARSATSSPMMSTPARAPAADVSGLVRLLGPVRPVPAVARPRARRTRPRRDRKDLWRTLGRPGGVLVGHEVLGSWRPRASGKKLRVAVNAWAPLPDLTEQAERLAAFRGVTFDGFVDA